MRHLQRLKKGLFVLMGIGFLFGTSCIAPVNLQYESSRMMEVGTVELHGGVSRYTMENERTNTNYVGKLGFGITN